LTALLQDNQLSGKPGNFGELYRWENVEIFREKIVRGKIAQKLV